MSWNLAPCPSRCAARGEVAVLAAGGQRGLDRFGVVAGRAVVEDLEVGALLHQDLAVVHGGDVEEADAVLGVQSAGLAVAVHRLLPLVTDPVALLVRGPVGEQVGPPQRVGDEEGEQHPGRHQQLPEEADHRGHRPAAAPAPAPAVLPTALPPVRAGVLVDPVVFHHCH
jgi:hypothetical protein